MGRPATCGCGDCAKCKRRVKAREAYQSLSTTERRALVARRDPDAMRAADRARYYRDPEKRLAAARLYHETHREQVGEHKRRWVEKNPEKRKAQNAVGNALRDGRLVKGSCTIGGDCHGRIEAHHTDYSKPLDVTWLCAKHHASLRRIED